MCRFGSPALYDAAMDLLVAAAKPWHFWVGVTLFGGAVLAVLATIVGYLVRVTSSKYPRQ